MATQQKTSSQIFANLSQGQRIAFITITIAFALLIAYSFINLLGRVGKTAIITQFAPYDAKVYLNNSPIKNHSTNYIKNGTYTLKVERADYATTERQVIINSDSKYLVGTLSASTEAGEQHAKQHEYEFIETQALVGAQLNLEGINKKKEYPVITKLPFNSALFSLSYRYPDDNPNAQPVLIIKSSPEQLNAAVSKLFNYAEKDDITRYKIEFVGHQNPFLPPEDLPHTQSATEFLETVYPSELNHDYRYGEAKTMDKYYIVTAHLYDFDLDLHYANYRIVLEQDTSGYWNFATTPQVILTQDNSPKVPMNVLKAANQLK